MKERPILFSAPMVRAILGGHKTMTRRVAIPRHDDRTPCEHWSGGYCEPEAIMSRHCEHGSEGRPCPYGCPGDRLWVKETWKPHCEGPISDEFPLGTCVKYRADGAMVKPTAWTNEQGAWCEAQEESEQWRSPLHMPRWASRITLEVTGVKVERVQDISQEDAAAEGSFIGRCQCAEMQRKSRTPIEAVFRQTGCHIHGIEFRELWNDINAKRGFGWDVNPWVWVIEFRKTLP